MRTAFCSPLGAGELRIVCVSARRSCGRVSEPHFQSASTTAAAACWLEQMFVNVTIASFSTALCVCSGVCSISTSAPLCPCTPHPRPSATHSRHTSPAPSTRAASGSHAKQ